MRSMLNNDKAAKFLSTPSGWRATCETVVGTIQEPYFYPRPPGGGRRSYCLHTDGARFLSTPSGWRATVPRWHCAAPCSGFLSTPSGWRATGSPYLPALTAARFLSTPSGWRATSRVIDFVHDVLNFYPRPPGGGRLASFAHAAPSSISIHALRVEGDD